MEHVVLDKETLDKVAKKAEEYGWLGDFGEVEDFVHWLYKEYWLEPPILKNIKNKGR